MRHEWTDDEGVRWYAKDGTIYGAEFGRVGYGADNEPYDEEVSEGDVGVESPLPAPALEILRLREVLLALVLACDHNQGDYNKALADARALLKEE